MASNRHNFIHIVGKQNHGKTTLITDMVALLSGRGLKVGSIKHSAHRHELEAEKKDSYRHRKAGANPAAVITLNLMGVFLPRLPDQDPYDRLLPLFDSCDVVLVEGDINRQAPKVEVWRKAIGTPALVSERDDIQAIITDDIITSDIPVWRRSDRQDLADKLLSMIGKY